MGATVAGCSGQGCGRCGGFTIAADSKLGRLAMGVPFGAHASGAEDVERAVAIGIANNVRDFSETVREFNAAESDGKVGFGADPSRAVQDKLWQACREGNYIRTVQALGRGGREADVHAQTLRGQTALMLAAASNAKGTTDVLRFLLDAMSDPETKDSNGWTALLHACRNNRQEAAVLLLERNASIRARGADGSTCAMLAAMDAGDNLVMDLVGRQAPIDKKNDRGWTVLFVAASDGRAELVRWLIKKQANVKDKASDGTTAIMAATASGNKKVAERLHKKGCSINSTNIEGDTALMLSVKARKEEFANWLIEAGCVVAVRNNKDEDALELADSQGMAQLRNKIELRLRLIEDVG